MSHFVFVAQNLIMTQELLMVKLLALITNHKIALVREAKAMFS